MQYLCKIIIIHVCMMGQRFSICQQLIGGWKRVQKWQNINFRYELTFQRAGRHGFCRPPEIFLPSWRLNPSPFFCMKCDRKFSACFGLKFKSYNWFRNKANLVNFLPCSTSCYFRRFSGKFCDTAGEILKPFTPSENDFCYVLSSAYTVHINMCVSK